MTQTLTHHLTEYRAQIEQLQRQIIALTGAIQALERLQKEEQNGDSQDSNQN